MESFDDAERRLARKLGSEMRRLRERNHLTQSALGRRAGHYSRSTIATVETGWGKCSLKLIQRCDETLGAGGALVRTYFKLREAQTRRKEAARNPPAEQRAQGSHPEPDGVHSPAFLDRVKRSLDSYGQLRDPEYLPLLEDVEQRVVHASTRYQAGDYDSAGALLVDLIGNAAALAAAQNGRAEPRVLSAQVWTYRLAAMLATRCGDAGTARLAADRAAAAATYSGSPLLQGVAMYQVACAFNLAGELEIAQQAASDAAEMLFRRGDRASPVQISIRGALLLEAMVIAARRGERREAAHHLTEAERMADELGVDANHAWTAFGPTNVRTHGLAAALALGDVDRAIEIGEAIEPERFPPGLIGRRCQVHLDTASAYAERRQDSEALIHLLLVEATGPQVIRYNPEVRRLVANLLGRERRSALPGLRYLARQVGMTA